MPLLHRLLFLRHLQLFSQTLIVLCNEYCHTQLHSILIYSCLNFLSTCSKTVGEFWVTQKTYTDLNVQIERMFFSINRPSRWFTSQSVAAKYCYTLNNLNELECHYHSDWEKMWFASYLKFIFYLLMAFTFLLHIWLLLENGKPIVASLEWHLHFQTWFLFWECTGYVYMEATTRDCDLFQTTLFNLWTCLDTSALCLCAIYHKMGLICHMFALL